MLTAMRSKQLVVRPATDSDVQAAFKLMAELGYPDLSLSRFAETYHSVLRHPAMTLIVAEDDDGEVIGVASISRRPQLRLIADLITIDELVVADSARGRGVGHALLEHIKTMVRKAGARRLELETNRARESYRRAFYIKNGFVEADSAVMRIDYELSEFS
jgi:N-acetylglutamate synthase-like GNAT family acetyltransferase